jgi:acetate kinase
MLSGKVERIGMPGTVLTVTNLASRRTQSFDLQAADPSACVSPVLEVLNDEIMLDLVGAIGHRIVHGGPRYRQPHWISAELLDALRALSPLDPDHLPLEISLIEACAERHPEIPQIAFFDTAFHADMPRVARLMPIPRRYAAAGIQRYGFHGLSYSYLMEELERIAGRDAAHGRLILAHLGNGASLAAVRNGSSRDTTMSLTPTSGIPMSTRSGDVDPGYVSYVLKHEGLSVDQFHAMVNTQAGLLGVSDISSDVRDLLARESSDEGAADAIALFCYHVKKTIGAFAAVLGGVDTLVFSGGIGENAATIRRRVCEGMGFLGIVLDDARNVGHAPIISEEGSAVTVRVIPTDEEGHMARMMVELLSRAPTVLASGRS